MSDNLELLRDGIEAYNRGDISFVLERASDDVEVRADPALMNAGEFRGRAAFERWMQEWLEAWRETTLEVRSVKEIDGRFLLVDVLQRATGSGSGVEVEMEIWQLVEARDGEIVRFHLCASRDRAEAALASLRAESGVEAES